MLVIFSECDHDGDGQLSADECAERWEKGMTFADTDTNSDGQVTWEEMVAAAAKAEVHNGGQTTEDRGSFI